MNCVREITDEHPGYGFRRMLPELEERMGQAVNTGRLRRFLNKHELDLPRQVSRRSPSPVEKILEKAAGQLNLVAGRDPGPLEAFSTDFTEVFYADGNRKAYLMAVVDLESKYVPGWAVGPSADRKPAMRCWERVCERMSALSLPLRRIVHHDQDSVYTSYRWLRAILLDDGLRVSYSERGAKGNPWIESLWARTKTSGWITDRGGLVPSGSAECLRQAVQVLQPKAATLLDRLHFAPRTSRANSRHSRIRTATYCCVLAGNNRPGGPRSRAHIPDR